MQLWKTSFKSLIYNILTLFNNIELVATFEWKGSQTGQEVIFDLLSCFSTFENLDGIE